MHIAMIGTRGVPAAYGGFETAIEEIGSRLAERGHDITVYCRSVGRHAATEHLGMKLVNIPAVRMKTIETLSHTALSVAHAVARARPDAAFVFNAANAPFVPLLRSRKIPTAVHVDGLEWKRDKWGGAGRRYYRWAEQASVRQADALIADAQGIADYYHDEFAVPTELIAYGTRILRETPGDRLTELGLSPNGYHLVVARFEPENHVDVILEGYRASSAQLPLVVVGSAPYSAGYVARIHRLAHGDSRIHLLGGIWDREQLDQLYAHARTYLHGHSVGGTNPSLLRAMGAGTAVLAWDVVFNREVLGPTGGYFGSSSSLGLLLGEAELNPHRVLDAADAVQARAEALYRWDDVTSGYEALAQRLIDGYSTRGVSKGRRRADGWIEPASPLSAPLEKPVRGRLS